VRAYNEDHVYAFEAGDMRLLEEVKTRLYEDKPLSGDQRRDLANTLDAVLDKAVDLSPGLQ
jgi:hypothetical protein